MDYDLLIAKFKVIKPKYIYFEFIYTQIQL